MLAESENIDFQMVTETVISSCPQIEIVESAQIPTYRNFRNLNPLRFQCLMSADDVREQPVACTEKEEEESGVGALFAEHILVPGCTAKAAALMEYFRFRQAMFEEAF